MEIENSEDSLRAISGRIRQNTLKAIHAARSGHPGGSLSCVEILVSLYFKELQPQPYSPEDPECDIFIMSKGHAAPALYATFVELGLLDIEELLTLRKFGSRLQGHPSVRDLPFVSTSTGSLGQGLSVAVGMATGFKLKGSSRRVYCLVGDGDMQEGMSNEAFRFADYNQLNNLCIIWDRNHKQSDEYSVDYAYPAFVNNWHVEVCNGHDFHGLNALYYFSRFRSSKPVLIVAETVKGRGVGFMEKSPSGYHGSVVLSDDELERALAEL